MKSSIEHTAKKPLIHEKPCLSFKHIFIHVIWIFLSKNKNGRTYCAESVIFNKLCPFFSSSCTMICVNGPYHFIMVSSEIIDSNLSNSCYWKVAKKIILNIWENNVCMCVCVVADKDSAWFSFVVVCVCALLVLCQILWGHFSVS